MSEKSFENFQSNLGESDKDFLDDIDVQSDILDDETLDLFARAKAEYLSLNPTMREQLVQGYESGLKDNRFVDNQKIMVEEFLRWAKDENRITEHNKPSNN